MGGTAPSRSTDRVALGRQVVGAIHNQVIFSRRVDVISTAIAGLLPKGARLLDIGAGSGDMAVAVQSKSPGLEVEGVDVLVRGATRIPVREFDGTKLPYPDKVFSTAMLVDVLHHTDDPAVVLREAARVADQIIIKDHFRNGLLAGPRLRFMDWVGNAPHGVRLPYNYLSRSEWGSLWSRLGLSVDTMIEKLPLYRGPLQWVFGEGLHFVVRLSHSSQNGTDS